MKAEKISFVGFKTGQIKWDLLPYQPPWPPSDQLVRAVYGRSIVTLAFNEWLCLAMAFIHDGDKDEALEIIRALNEYRVVHAVFKPKAS